MEITKRNIDKLNAEITLKISPVDYGEGVDKVLRDYRRKVNMDGFRKGCVPMGVLRKMYGKALLLDEINKIISEKLNVYLSENHIDHFYSPILKEDDPGKLDLDFGKVFNFTFELGLMPSFDVKFEGEKFDRCVIAVDDSMVSKYSDDLRIRYGKQVDADEITADSDIVHCTFQQLDESGEPMKKGIHSDTFFTPGTILSESLKEKVKGLKAGDSLIVNPGEIHGNTDDLAMMLKIKPDIAENITPHFRIVVSKITRQVPAEINDDFFQLLFGKDVVKSQQEFNEKIIENLKINLKNKSEQKLNNDILDRLLQKTKIPLPDEFLQKWLSRSNDKNQNGGANSVDYTEFAKYHRYKLILNKLSEKNNIKADDEELKDYAKSMVLEYYSKYAVHFDQAQLDKMANTFLENKDELEEAKNNVVFVKIMNFLKKNARIQEKAVSNEEFKLLLEEKPQKTGWRSFFKNPFGKK